MPLFPAQALPIPDYWKVYGHSYFQFNFGTRTQSGRADAVFRASMDIEHTNFANHACNGSRVSLDLLPNGGWARVMQNSNASLMNFPYVSMGGAYLFCWGINDLGYNTDTQQFRDNYAMCLRATLSRCRMSTRRDDDYGGTSATGNTTYGAGFTNLGFSNDFSSGPSAAPGWATIRQASSTTSATFTITLPSDYTGSPICIQMVANPGVAGGTITWSGTAGVTGTTSTSNLVPLALGAHTVCVKRITTLTSANASQTIIGTVTALDASGFVFFDSWWIESETPEPVILCNISKLTTAGYAIYTTPPTDAQVDTWNAVTAGVVAEFDSMVQVVDIDSAMGKAAGLTTDPKTPTYAADGLHPNENGAGRIADACLLAIKRLQPTTKMGGTVHVNPQSARRAAVIRPRVNGLWYQSDTYPNTAGTAYTAVSGDFWAIPFYVCDGQSQISQWSVQLASSSVATSVMLALYDDRQLRGYPQYMHAQPCSTTALSLAASAGAKLSTTTPGSNGYILQPLDPGLYWWGLKIITAGTTTFTTMSGQSPYMPNNTAGSIGVFNGYKMTGQGTTALPGMFPPGGVASTNSPLVGFKIQLLGEP
jgi:hypothetical protein